MSEEITPGRWEAVETAGLWVVTSHEPALSATCVRIVATAWQGEADARLIASAKEAKAERDELQAALRTIVEEADAKGCSPYMREAINQARATLTKAEGRED